MSLTNPDAKFLAIMCGIPGAGKSSIAAGMKSQSNAVIASADQYWYALGDGKYKFHAPLLSDAHQYCRNKAKLAIEENRNVVVDNTNLRDFDIANWIEVAPPEYNIKLCLVKCRMEDAMIRGLHNVPKEKYPAMQKAFESILATFERVRSPYQAIGGRSVEVLIIENRRL